MNLPKISIVVLGYLESNRRYLDACLKSVAALDYPQELIDLVVVSPYLAHPDPYVKIIKPPEPGSFSRSVNEGVRNSDPASEFILILSDDTIISKGSLRAMVGYGDNALIGAMSNCDLEWKYNLELPVTGLNRYYKFAPEGQGDPPIKEMIGANSPMPRGTLITDTLCFYAVLIPRKIWDEVGPLDEDFNMGYEDTFFCYKARSKGFQIAVAMDALIFHAGGQSSELINDSMRASNVAKFNEKMSKL